MIGNTIWFVYLGTTGSQKQEILKGIVVDAFTDISGKSETFLGMGSGKTRSNRMYKVMHYNEWDKEEKHYPIFTDIYDWQLKSIYSFAKNINQETNEEKIIGNP